MGRRALRGDQAVDREQSGRACIPVTRAIIEGARNYRRRRRLRSDRTSSPRLRRQTAAAWAAFDVMAVPTIPRPYTIAEVEADPVRAQFEPRDLHQFREPARSLRHRRSLRHARRRIAVEPDPDRRRPARTDFSPAIAAQVQIQFGRAMGATGLAVEAPPPAPLRASPGLHRDCGGRRASLRPAAQSRAHVDSAASCCAKSRPPPDYRLYALPGTAPAEARPAARRTGEGGSIAAEIWASRRQGVRRASSPPCRARSASARSSFTDGRERQGLSRRGRGGQRRRRHHPLWRLARLSRLAMTRLRATAATIIRRSAAAPAIAGRTARGLAVYIALNLEHFAFGEGLGAELAPGGPQPDVLNYAWRDYGNRVGAWRLLDLLDALNCAGSVLINSDIYAAMRPGSPKPSARAATSSSATAAPTASGRASLDEAAEAALIAEATAMIARQEGAPPEGLARPLDLAEPRRRPICWPRPATPICSTGAWTTSRSGCARASGPILAVPYPQEINDIPMIVGRKIEGPALRAHDRRPFRRDARAERATSRW